MVPATSPASAPAVPVLLHAEYFTTSDGAYTEIDVDGADLRVRYFPGDTPGCKKSRARAAQPCWKPSDIVTRTAHITAGERAALVALVRASGFLALGPACGGTGPHHPFYAEQIDIALGADARDVVHEIFPGAAPAPAAFTAVRQALLDLAHAKTGAP